MQKGNRAFFSRFNVDLNWLELLIYFSLFLIFAVILSFNGLDLKSEFFERGLLFEFAEMFAILTIYTFVVWLGKIILNLGVNQRKALNAGPIDESEIEADQYACVANMISRFPALAKTIKNIDLITVADYNHLIELHNQFAEKARCLEKDKGLVSSKDFLRSVYANLNA